jgi:hypothetical protein
LPFTKVERFARTKWNIPEFNTSTQKWKNHTVSVGDISPFNNDLLEVRGKAYQILEPGLLGVLTQGRVAGITST